MRRKAVVWLFVGTAAIVIMGCVRQSISGFSPTYGPPGTEVTVSGVGLVDGNQPANTSVEIGAVAQPDLDAAFTEVKFRVHPGSITGPIRIQTPQGIAIAREVFEVVDDATNPNGPFTFGGTGAIQAVKVTPTGLNQPVLMAVFRARWSPNTGISPPSSPTATTRSPG